MKNKTPMVFRIISHENNVNGVSRPRNLKFREWFNPRLTACFDYRTYDDKYSFQSVVEAQNLLNLFFRLNLLQ